MRGYSGNKARAILTKLGSKVRLPKVNHEVLVVETDLVRVYLVNAPRERRDRKDKYYFRERMKPRRHVPQSKVVKIASRVLSDSEILATLREGMTARLTLTDIFK